MAKDVISEDRVEGFIRERKRLGNVALLKTGLRGELLVFRQPVRVRIPSALRSSPMIWQWQRRREIHRVASRSAADLQHGRSGRQFEQVRNIKGLPSA